MKNKIINVIKNFLYTFSSNFISMIISTFITLIIPKIIGVKDYGYWQLYIFYSSYVGLLHFGWNDGIYLRYGGKEYKHINKRLLFSQYYMLFFLQVIMAFIIFLIVKIYGIDENKLFITKMLSLCLLIVNMRCMLLYILQSTNRLKEYSWITLLDKIIYFTLISVFIITGFKNYKMMILADNTGKLISLILAIYFCKDIVFQKYTNFFISIKEMLKNINAGIKLMFANIASLLIIGVVRFGIECYWDIETFGKVSLTFSISNFIMLFINAAALVMFPTLKRINEKKLSSVYNIMRDFLMIYLFGILILYYPLKVLISLWLPKYIDSLKYMAILLPMCVYEGKMSLLINTYLKSLRKEKFMLYINIITLSLSAILTYTTIYVFKSLDYTIILIVFSLAFRCIISEISLSKILEITILKDIILENIVTFIFIVSAIYIKSWFTILTYGITYFLYLVIKRTDVKRNIHYIKALLNT